VTKTGTGVYDIVLDTDRVADDVKCTMAPVSATPVLRRHGLHVGRDRGRGRCRVLADRRPRILTRPDLEPLEGATREPNARAARTPLYSP